MVQTYTTRTTCRVCGSNELNPLFSLGDQYVSDFVDKEKILTGPRCPIDIELCLRCGLVQAKHTAPQDFLYSRHYWYRSGVTATMRGALADVVEAIAKRLPLERGDIWLDIGANDGTLLNEIEGHGLVRVAVEPATNLTELCRANCDVLVPDFWNAESYIKAVGDSMTLSQESAVKFLDRGVLKAKVITACGMFYDLEDPNQFIADIARVLHPEGLFVAQLMCAKQTLEMRDVGNFAHEHLEFYTLDSLNCLFGRHGLTITDIQEVAVNGKSYRLFVQKSEHRRPISQEAQALYKYECDMNLSSPDSYVGFRSEIETWRRRLHAFVSDRVAEGKSVWVYGASTKGNVILQYCGLDHRLIGAAVERSPEKVGKFTAGTGLPIVSEGEFRESYPDYALILPYAFTEEFVERESDFLRNGGQFIVPLPYPRVIGVDKNGNEHWADL